MSSLRADTDVVGCTVLIILAAHGIHNRQPHMHTYTDHSSDCDWFSGVLHATGIQCVRQFH